MVLHYSSLVPNPPLTLLDEVQTMPKQALIVFLASLLKLFHMSEYQLLPYTLNNKHESVVVDVLLVRNTCE